MLPRNQPLACRNCSTRIKDLGASLLCKRCGSSLLDVGLGPLANWRPADLCAWLLQSNLAMVCGAAFLFLTVEMVLASSALSTGWLNTHLSLILFVAGSVSLLVAQRKYEAEPTSNCGRCGYDVADSGTECFGCGRKLADVGIAVRDASTLRARWTQTGTALMALPILVYALNIVIVVSF